MVTKEVLEGMLRLEVSLDDVILFVSTGWSCLPEDDNFYILSLLLVSTRAKDSFIKLSFAKLLIGRRDGFVYPRTTTFSFEHIRGRQFLQSLAATCHDQGEGELYQVEFC